MILKGKPRQECREQARGVSLGLSDEGRPKDSPGGASGWPGEMDTKRLCLLASAVGVSLSL